MHRIRNTKAVAIASAALAVTAGGVMTGVGPAASNGAGGGASVRLQEGWPVSSHLSDREVRREARAAARADGGRVFTLIERVRRFEFVDVGAEGESAGDSIFFESALFTPGGERVGRDSVECTVAIRTFVCTATFQVTGRGKIMVSGAFFAHEPHLAITGGTRDFRAASGQFFPSEGSDEDIRLVFQLTD